MKRDVKEIRADVEGVKKEFEEVKEVRGGVKEVIADLAEVKKEVEEVKEIIKGNEKPSK